MKIYDLWKKIFFQNYFYLISSLFFQMHKVRMCVVWHKIKIHATKCPYPRNVQIPFLWPKCLYYCHINRSKYTKIKWNTLYILSILYLEWAVYDDNHRSRLNNIDKWPHMKTSAVTSVIRQGPEKIKDFRTASRVYSTF